MALVVGWPLMRLSGISASIATFAVLVVTYVVLGNWTSVTGGQNSLMGLPLYIDLWTAARLGGRGDRDRLRLPGDPLGAAACAPRARTRRPPRRSGVHVVRHRLIAFVISGFLSGIAGVLLAHFLGTVRVETFYLDLTFLIVAMLVIGGMRSLTGAVSGAIVIAALTELLRQVEIGFSIGGATIAAPPGLGDAILALIMLLIILFRPKGIAGGKEIAWPFGADMRRPSATALRRPMCYASFMDENRIAEVLSRARAWPREAQEELAEIALEIQTELEAGDYAATDEELRGIDRGLRDVAEGRFATDEDVAAVIIQMRRPYTIYHTSRQPWAE